MTFPLAFVEDNALISRLLSFCHFRVDEFTAELITLNHNRIVELFVSKLFVKIVNRECSKNYHYKKIIVIEYDMPNKERIAKQKKTTTHQYEFAEVP